MFSSKFKPLLEEAAPKNSNNKNRNKIWVVGDGITSTERLYSNKLMNKVTRWICFLKIKNPNYWCKRLWIKVIELKTKFLTFKKTRLFAGNNKKLVGNAFGGRTLNRAPLNNRRPQRIHTKINSQQHHIQLSTMIELSIKTHVIENFSSYSLCSWFKYYIQALFLL